ncbi:MAG: DNA polymerase IV [Acidobacteria bacterium]|nr:DNA polymerase IV [Acidobacteriota bacterium]
MTEFPKTVFHVDMDAFFVSVEELFDPALKGKPVVVGGQRQERGVVSAASYEARKFGVHSAMPLRTAARLCPEATFVDGHPDRYREYSEKVYRVLESFSPQVEMVSIDEAYVDMTGTARLHGPPMLAAHKLHASMKAQTQLNCSIGIGASRLIAKVCSGKAKPHGVFYAIPGGEAKLLAPLDVRDIPGVGKVTEQKLRGLGIHTVGDMATIEDRLLERHLGKWGLALAGKARGEDAGAWFAGTIGQAEPAKSISHEHTFNEDTANVEQIEATLMRLSEMVGRRLREHGFQARTVQLKLRYKDFTTITRARTLEMPTQLDNEIFREIDHLFHANWRKGAEIRLLGVQASSFAAPSAQGDFLNDGDRGRWQQALSAVDRVRDRFGESSITLATGMKGGFRERTHENPVGLPGKDKPVPD